jgi:hypothetical protein
MARQLIHSASWLQVYVRVGPCYFFLAPHACFAARCRLCCAHTAGSLIPAAGRKFCFKPELAEVPVGPDGKHSAWLDFTCCSDLLLSQPTSDPSRSVSSRWPRSRSRHASCLQPHGRVLSRSRVCIRICLSYTSDFPMQKGLISRLAIPTVRVKSCINLIQKMQIIEQMEFEFKIRSTSARHIDFKMQNRRPRR